MTGHRAVAFDPGLTRREALKLAAAHLRNAGIADGERDARFLLLGLLNLTPRDLALDGDRPIGDAAAELKEALAQRVAGEPVARILGAWEFWGLPFALAPETLVPRPDTETVVEAALAALPERRGPSRILDLGTGSGCLLVALLTELPDAVGIGIDRSAAALRAARANAGANGVGARALFVCGDWCEAVTGPFDLVVSNPPYIPTDAIAGLDREVSDHDPRAALDGGDDGLVEYRRILRSLGEGRLLSKAAPLVLEIGHDQADAVRTIGAEMQFKFARLSHDLAGRDRALTFVY